MNILAKKRISVVSTALLVVVTAISLAQAQNQPAQPKAALTVSTIAPQMVEWPVLLVANGNIAAWQEATVGAEASGLALVDVRVHIGDRVRKGQVLALLQSETVKAELEQARAGLAEARAAHAEAKANADRARLLEKSDALSAQQITQYLTAEQTAVARVAGLKAQLKAAQIRLAQTRIVAPDHGTIILRNATLGAVVSSGNELFRLIRRDRLEWRAELPAAELARIAPGQTVHITTPGRNSIQGRVRMVAPTVELQTRNGLVYVDLLKNADARAGMFARGEILIGSGKLLAVPQTAVLLRDGFSYVFRVGQDKRVIQTKVGVGQRAGDLIAVTSGLEAGVSVVAAGVGFLADGDLVRLVPTPAR